MLCVYNIIVCVCHYRLRPVMGSVMRNARWASCCRWVYVEYNIMRSDDEEEVEEVIGAVRHL